MSVLHSSVHELIASHLPPLQLCPLGQATIGPHSRQPSALRSPQVTTPAPRHSTAPAWHSSLQALVQAPFEQTSSSAQGTGASQSLHESLSALPQARAADGPSQRVSPAAHSSTQLFWQTPNEQKAA